MNKKQVDKSHYEFSRYVHKPRWASMWHQLDEVIKLNPGSVLEVGPGPGLFKAMAQAMNVHVETLDLDPELNPDHVASVFEMPFDDGQFDVVCAFQMLEHLPFEKSLGAFKEMARVASNSVAISLPDAATRWPFSVHIPKIGSVKFSVPRPRLRPLVHEFNGEHYWEISKAGYPLSRIISEFTENAPVELTKTFRVPEYPYHRFLIFKA
ncbi:MULTISPECIES: class I SAM-dependent methyltransferase [unclassified Ectothiorhodospira]|uniref:class I SAM-dependent methyltransferase n=1 Tax=unclassified Ectothiorhodospira TaxID=2684909 RepID=UPI001EE94DA4|nr:MULTISPECIES: class I SAM-dependent methyltransferase [unclassified Ectothiorhodospira]MCG5516372.1 class I SAM-dependent methyltransferase [Ectothiorhodospira sp. 9100]MCG5519378.1 class I SAM-dependent methyltransferase [Ectothiorhodospira sp. 9905]